MIGFVGIVVTRAVFMLQLCGTNKYLSTALSSSVGKSFALMIAIGNRGVDSGNGEGMDYGRNVLGLVGNYFQLIRHQACSTYTFGILKSCYLLLIISYTVVTGVKLSIYK